MSYGFGTRQFASLHLDTAALLAGADHTIVAAPPSGYMIHPVYLYSIEHPGSHPFGQNGATFTTKWGATGIPDPPDTNGGGSPGGGTIGQRMLYAFDFWKNVGADAAAADNQPLVLSSFLTGWVAGALTTGADPYPITVPGTTYTAGDTGTFGGGILPATFTINTVDGGGGILTYTINTSGVPGSGYIQGADTSFNADSSGDGGATININAPVVQGNGSVDVYCEYYVVKL